MSIGTAQSTSLPLLKRNTVDDLAGGTPSETGLWRFCVDFFRIMLNPFNVERRVGERDTCKEATKKRSGLRAIGGVQSAYSPQQRRPSRTARKNITRSGGVSENHSSQPFTSRGRLAGVKIAALTVPQPRRRDPNPEVDAACRLWHIRKTNFTQTHRPSGSVRRRPLQII